MSDFPVTIYHNPACGTSRNTLAMIKQAGYAPLVIDYVKAGWTSEVLTHLLTRMGQGPRFILRDKGTPALALGLLEPEVTDATILSAMLAHPILVNRPIVETPLGVVLARPSEKVAEVLDRPIGPFTKEDGEIIGK
jgi:arsenate reductase (glutaredoxin)